MGTGVNARRNVNTAWLTRAEESEYRRRVELRKYVARTDDTQPLPRATRTRLRTLRWRYLGASAAATVLAALVAGFAASDDPAQAILPASMMTWFITLIGALFAHGAHVHHAYTRWAQDYLDEIGYATRSGPPTRLSRPGGYRSHPGSPSYPVTDGSYDPILYTRRGGRDTLRGMREAGIDDFDTYQSNVLEAD